MDYYQDFFILPKMIDKFVTFCPLSLILFNNNDVLQKYVIEELRSSKFDLPKMIDKLVAMSLNQNEALALTITANLSIGRYAEL